MSDPMPPEPAGPRVQRAAAAGPSEHHRDASSASPPPQAKVPVKISCLACRAAKRKCLTPDAFTVCKRCADQGLECEYKKHRRGRRKKVPDEVAAAATGTTDGDGARSSPGRGSRASHSRSRSPEPGRGGEERYGAASAAPREHGRAESGASERPRHGVMFSHVVPIEGDSSPYLPRPGQPPEPTSGPSLSHLRTDCPDPVANGFLTEADAYELFEFYFHHLNVTVAILDPVLHTATYCRDKSPLLFSAVLTVTAKIIRPKAYNACLLVSNKLVGQAVEFGLCSIEVIQAILMLTHWKKADDATSWRKTGYAIRMAQELRLNHRAPRPLPKNERQAREVLNRERCWLNLIVADYHLAMHHSLPRMINEDDVDDPMEWITEHPHLPCPGESLIAPWMSFSRLCRLFADMLASMNGSQSNLRMLHWLEMEFKRWRTRWIVKNGKLLAACRADTAAEYNFLQEQVATIKMCDGLLHFHICEYRLLFIARYRSKGEPLDTSKPSELSYAFAACADQALALLDVFQTDLVRHGYLPYCFNLVWVGVAITSVWLVKNIGAMDQVDRARVIRTLTEVSEATADSSCSSDDMASYTHRLLKHLLGSLAPDYMLNAGAPPASGVVSSAPSARTVDVDTPPLAQPPPVAAPPVQLPTWTMPSAQQIIQEHLWHPSLFEVCPANTPYTQQQQARPPPNPHQPATIMPDGVPGQIPTDVLFPAADDDIWKLLFPL